MTRPWVCALWSRREALQAALLVPLAVRSDMMRAQSEMEALAIAGSADVVSAIFTLDARRQIEDLMADYARIRQSGQFAQLPQIFAGDDDISIEIADLGIYSGPVGLRRFVMAMAHADPCGPDRLDLVAFTTPVIELTGTNSAMGVWWAPGMAADGSNAQWRWDKYGVDFVCSADGAWKISHFRQFHLFRAAFNGSWAVPPACPVPDLPDDLMPDRQPSHHWLYSQTVIFEVFPPTPAPPKP